MGDRPLLVTTPPLQEGVDEGDLLLALNTFEGFKEIFFYKTVCACGLRSHKTGLPSVPLTFSFYRRRRHSSTLWNLKK